jgi:hypothetical protein
MCKCLKMDVAAYIAACLGGLLLAFAGAHGFANKSVTVISFGTGAILVVIGGCFYWQDAIWKKEAVQTKSELARSEKALSAHQRRELCDILKDYQVKRDQIGIWFPEGDLRAYEFAQSIRDALVEAKFTNVRVPTAKPGQDFFGKRKRSDLVFTRIQAPSENYNAVSILAQAFAQIGYSVDVKPIENLAEQFEIYVQPTDSKPPPRPSIQVRNIDFTYHAAEGIIVVSLVAENVGDAPAQDVVFVSSGRIDDAVLTVAPELSTTPEMPRSTVLVSRTIRQAITIPDVSPEVMEKLKRKELFLYVFGVVFYMDWPNTVQHSCRFGGRYDALTNHFIKTTFHNTSD